MSQSCDVSAAVMYQHLRCINVAMYRRCNGSKLQYLKAAMAQTEMYQQLQSMKAEMYQRCNAVYQICAEMYQRCNAMYQI